MVFGSGRINDGQGKEAGRTVLKGLERTLNWFMNAIERNAWKQTHTIRLNADDASAVSFAVSTR